MTLEISSSVDSQRRAAFNAFDLDGSGAITQFDLRYAFQACEGIAKLVEEKDVVMAMRRVGVPPGQLISFAVFDAMCNVVEEFLRPRREVQEYASRLQAMEQEEEKHICQASPRRTTRSIPLEAWHDQLPVEPQALPSSPRSPRACLGELPGMDPVAHAFYAFDMDYSGAVSGCELPRMLRMVPRRGGGTLGRPGGESKQKVKMQARWDEKLRAALRAIDKEYSDLLNLHDFQAIVDFFDPPPPPLQPEDEGYETTESEKARRAEAEERRRREEEARAEAERINAGTLVVRFDDRFLVLHFCDKTDKVSNIMRLISEKTGIDLKDMRLLGRGFEMDERNRIEDYGVKVGHPQTHGGDILQLLIRGPPMLKDDAPVVISGPVNIRLMSGRIIQIMAEDDEPIEHFMWRVEEQEGTPVASQRLVCHGRELNARKTFRDYQITFGPEGDVVDLLLRERPAFPERNRNWAVAVA